jgi:hypothetical protein
MSSFNTPASMTASPKEMDAQAVLDQTRQDLREYLMGDRAPSRSDKAAKGGDDLNAAGAHSASSSFGARKTRASKMSSGAGGIDWMGLVKAGISTWWRDHPLHVGATVLTPVVSDYVRRKPVASLTVAAAAGAAFVLVRPWRIASVAALGMSLVRSSNLPVMAASVVATMAENLQKEQT